MVGCSHMPSVWRAEVAYQGSVSCSRGWGVAASLHECSVLETELCSSRGLVDSSGGFPALDQHNSAIL